MTDKTEIKKALDSNRIYIRNLGVKRLGLFGSAVHDSLTDQSDIDFIVEFNTGSKSFDNYIDLAFFLESLLMRNVDLLTNDSLTESFKNRIQGEVEYIEV